jgi:MFS family permease
MPTQDVQDQAGVAETTFPVLSGSAVSRGYLLTLMALVTASQAVDRQVLALVIEPIKREFGLTDAQMGFLNGTVFGVAYAVSVVPFALLADRWSRRKVIALTVAFWSAATALTGSVTSYVQLIFTRTLVGVGEAGAGPAQLALLATRYPPEKRAGMVAVITAVGALTGLAAFSAAGFVVERLGWRSMFLLFGAPGLVLAALIWLTIQEPPTSGPGARDTLTFAELRSALLRAPVLHLFAASAWGAVVSSGALSWLGAFLVREYRLSLPSVGFWMGVMGVASGLVGALLGGYVANRAMARELRAGLKVALVAMVVCVPLHASAYLVHDLRLTLGLLVANALAAGFYSAPLAAQFINYMPEHSRATAMATLSMGILFVTGFGAALVGFISDFAAAHGAPSGLRVGLLVIALLGVVPVYHICGVLKHSPRAPSAA